YPPLPPLFPYTTLFRSAVDQVHTPRAQVRHVEELAVGADADVLRDAAVRERQVAQDCSAHPVDLYEPTGVLARHDEVSAVYRVRSEEHTSELQSPYDLV